MGALSAILVFRPLNKLGPLVANYKNGHGGPCVYPSGPTQPNLSPFGPFKNILQYQKPELRIPPIQRYIEKMKALASLGP